MSTLTHGIKSSNEALLEAGNICYLSLAQSARHMRARFALLTSSHLELRLTTPHFSRLGLLAMRTCFR
jgi:hypothetical protein